MDVTHQQEHHPFISKTRDRKRALNLLLPKILGIIWEVGKPRSNGGYSAKIDGDIALSVSNLMTLDVYAPMKSGLKKVLSTYVSGVRVDADPRFYKYCEGRVGVMSWYRGEWEDTIMADPASPMSISRGFFIRSVPIGTRNTLSSRNSTKVPVSSVRFA
jgi:hypothetical protein